MPQTQIDLVIPVSARHRPCLYPLARLPGVCWHAGISPEKLRDLYRSACALFLPLLDSTANNAIVEAMACGIPVITTDVGGSGEYLTEGAGILCPAGDIKAHADAAIHLLLSQEKARHMGEVARVHAEQFFSWDPIAEQLCSTIVNQQTL